MVGDCGQILMKKPHRIILISVVYFATGPILADENLPSGMTLRSGTATIHEKLKGLRIVQSTPKVIANWDSFNIGNGLSVEFDQPSADATMLNRVTGQNASKIMGNVSSNGKVILINQNGVIFGANARIDVGGLVAGILNISDEDFLNERYQFYGSETGEVVNFGTLEAKDQGLIALLAPKIRNEGIIKAKLGSVVLAAGTKVTLSNIHSGVTVVIDESVVEALIENKSLVKSEDGTVFMGAGAAASLQKSLIKNSGEISASRVTQKGGRILLEAGSISNSGKIDVSSITDGGGIDVSADHIEILPGSILDASGIRQGGSIAIGGGWQGARIGTRDTATSVSVDKGATIDASARLSGDGGSIVIWSDVDNPNSITEVSGRLLATGGLLSGNGGGIETSGYKIIFNEIFVNTAAIAGNFGRWLIDPTDIEIVSGSADASPDWNASQITAATIVQALANSNVEVATSAQQNGNDTGQITVNAPITWSSNSDLTLTGHGDIVINQTIDASGGSGGLILQYGQNSDYTVAAPISLSSSGTFRTRKGTDASVSYAIINDLGLQGSQTTTDLQGIAGDLSGNYVLGSDIDASGTQAWNSNTGFSALGTQNSRFTGIFDGLGHVITNFYINRSDDYQGIFGATEGAAIQNLNLTGGTLAGGSFTGSLVGHAKSTKINNVSSTNSISAFTTGPVNGDKAFGGLVGALNNVSTLSGSSYVGTISAITGFNGFTMAGGLVGTLSNSTILSSRSDVTIDGIGYVGGAVGQAATSIITDVSSGGAISGQESVGGLVGIASGSAMTRVSSSVDVTGVSNRYVVNNNDGTASSVGGLFGRLINNSTVNDGRASGDVSAVNEVGGLAGWLNGNVTVDVAAATGAVTGVKNIGGLFGISFALAQRTISNAMASGNVYGNENVGGLVGYSSNLNLTNSYSISDIIAQDSAQNVGGLIGLTENTNSVTDSFFSGIITYDEHDINIGGLIGTTVGSTSVQDSFWDLDVSRISTSDAGVGKTHSELTTLQTFANWDISSNFNGGSAWNFVGGNTPSLSAVDPSLLIDSAYVATLLNALAVGDVTISGYSNVSIESDLVYTGSNNRSLVINVANGVNLIAGRNIGSTSSGSLALEINANGNSSLLGKIGYSANGTDYKNVSLIVSGARQCDACRASIPTAGQQQLVRVIWPSLERVSLAAAATRARLRSRVVRALSMAPPRTRS